MALYEILLIIGLVFIILGMISILKDVINDLIKDGPDLALIMLVLSFFGIVIIISGLLISYLF